MSFGQSILALLIPRRSLGARAERLAAGFLRHQGYRILAANLRSRLGEIDILAQCPDGRTIAVVEVKAAGSGSVPSASTFIQPEEHANRAKQRKLSALAGQLVRRFHLEDRPIRFDVIGVEYPPAGAPVIRHHPGAFESSF